MNAREAFEKYLVTEQDATPAAFERLDNGNYKVLQTRYEWAIWQAAAALKQKGEVVWEGKGCIVNGEHMTPELYVPSFRISNAGLKVDDLVHVTLSLPQQEQDDQGVSTNQEGGSK